MALAGCLREDHPLLQRVDEGFETSLASKADLCSHRLHLFGITFDHTRYMLCSLLYDHHLALFPVSSAYLDSQNYILGILCPISTSAPPISWQSQNITFVGRRMWQVVTAKKNRISSIYHFVGWRKAEIGWIRPRRPFLKFCGKRFSGRVQTQRCADWEGVPSYW